ncbi:MAG TPA: ABC transporter ATP-binding protein [Gaiellaceae bacterium]|nr:ABC transporter ATP-binding protein [Gaiellaceae bacterium]
MAEVGFQNVTKIFGKVAAVDDVTLDVRDGEFVVLLGPSGCGKTTLLRCLAGLERVDAGRIEIGGRDATDLPPRKRRIAMVFQSYAVFPHMRVYDNVAFGLKMQKESKATIEERVGSAASLLHIEDFLDRYPAQLSGGQRQRVAVARAIATRADVLLMDEPLSNLDALLRMEMRAELKSLLQKLEATTIYVTHDQVEALSMGDRIAVMNAGRIVQVDTPLAVYDRPLDTFVGGFIGTPPMNFVHATVALDDGRPVARLGGGTVPLREDARAHVGREVVLGIRAESIEVETQPADGAVAATVVVVEPLGSHNLLTVRAGDNLVKVSVRPDLFPAPESELWLRIAPDRIRWMDSDGGGALGEEAEDLARSREATLALAQDASTALS